MDQSVMEYALCCRAPMSYIEIVRGDCVAIYTPLLNTRLSIYKTMY